MNAVRYIYFTGNMNGMAAFYRDVLEMSVKAPPAGMGYEEADFIQLQAGSVEIARQGRQVRKIQSQPR